MASQGPVEPDYPKRVSDSVTDGTSALHGRENVLKFGISFFFYNTRVCGRKCLNSLLLQNHSAHATIVYKDVNKDLNIQIFKN